MLQSSSGGPTRSQDQARALLAVTAELAVACFSRLFASALERLAASPDGGYPAELANSSVTTQVDLSASVWLAEQGGPLIAQFEDELRAQSDAFCAGAPHAPTTPALTLASLEQLGFEETEVLVTLRALAQWVEMLSHEEFYLFNHRFGYLCGEFALPPARNPFSPGRVLDALDRAGRRLAGYVDARLSLLRLLRRGGLEGAAAVYSALNQFLLVQGVLPRFRPKLRREIQEEDARLRAIGPITEEVERFRLELSQLAVEASRRLDPDYRSPEEIAEEQLQLARAEAEPGVDPGDESPGSGQVVPMPRADWRPAAAEPRLLPAAPVRRRPSESVLDAVRSSPVASRIGRIGAATLQITNFAFDQLLIAPQLPTPVRLLLSRLQGAFFKAALVDSSVMSARPHPVRRLINRLSEAGIAWSPELGEHDALYVTMASIVERLQRPSRDEIEAFEGELEHFEQFLEAETQVAKLAAAARARALYYSERDRVAHATAASEIDRSLHDEIYPPLPEFAERFVRDSWVHTLREAYLREGKEGKLWHSNLDFLHELTWSLKSKPTESERRILVRMLPELVARIEASVPQTHAAKALPDFLGELMQAHLHLVRRGELPPELHAEGVPGKARPRIDFQHALEELDPSLARRAPPPVVHVGTWVEFGTGTSLRYRKKLVWVSPLSHRALFTNRRGEGELVLTSEEIQQKLGSGQLSELRIVPLFERSVRDAKLRLGEDYTGDFR